MTRRRVVAGATAAGIAVLVAGGYWATMSSQSQLLGRFPYRGEAAHEADGRRVALTFDDGPNAPFTDQIAEALRQRGVRGTFFQVGRAVARQPETARSLLAAGHVIGNHSYSHELHRCFTPMLIDDEIRRAQAVFGDVLGLRTRLYRPPWLARTSSTFRLLERHHLQPVSGTFCHPLEVARCSADRIATRAVARARPGRMLIFHDGYNGVGAERGRTLDAVARTVDTLGERGWSFVTVDQLLAVDPYVDSRVRA